MSKTENREFRGIEPGTQKARKTVWKALVGIQQNWELNAAEMARLLHTNASTFHHWKTRGEVPVSRPPLRPDMEVVVAVVAIYRSLSAMFTNPRDQVAWLTTRHPDFEMAPLNFAVKSSPNVFLVRAYLDFVRGRGA